MRHLLFAMTITAMSIFGGAAAAGGPEGSGFMTNYSMFVEGPEDGADWVWIKAGKTRNSVLAKYDNVIVEPIVIWASKDLKSRYINPDELKQLADDFRAEIVNALKDRYPIVGAPGPKTMRLVVALTDVDVSEPVLDKVTSIVPTARIFSEIKAAVTGKHSFVGGASAEALVMDSQTNDPIIAAIDERFAEKKFFESVEGQETARDVELADAREVFRAWAKLMRQRFDEAHGGSR